MRKTLAAGAVVLSAFLGIAFSFSGLDNNLPWNIKTIKPKPDGDIIGIDEESDTVITNKITADESATPEIPEADLESTEYYDENNNPYHIFLIMATDIVYSTSGRKVKSLSGRTDSIMLAKFSDTGLDLVSIPRDTRVKIPGYGYEKINSANVFGGPELVLKTIEEWLGIKVKQYAVINTFGVVQFVDLFGGIDFNVPKRMYYVDNSAGLYINIKPGFQHLNGKNVHDFLRFRHDGMGDLNRVKRQQEIIKSIIPQILRPMNLLKLPSALQVVNDNMNTNVSSGELLGLAQKALSIESLETKIRMHTLPGSGRMYHGGWYWFIDENRANEILVKLALRKGTQASESNVRMNQVKESE